MHPHGDLMILLLSYAQPCPECTNDPILALFALSHSGDILRSRTGLLNLVVYVAFGHRASQ
jgi:hypothetical protein